MIFSASGNPRFEMKARRDGFCKICAGPIKQGDVLCPAICSSAEGSSNTSRSIWVHPECSSASMQADILPICKHWRRTGTCLVKDTCLFLHPDSLAAPENMPPQSNPATRTWQTIAASSGSVHLHVKNLPLAVTVEELTTLFSTFGGLHPHRSSCRPSMHPIPMCRCASRAQTSEAALVRRSALVSPCSIPIHKADLGEN